MGGFLHDTGSFTGASCKENVQDGGERGTDDLCSCVHCTLEGLEVCCTTVPIPGSDTACQHTLNGSPLESAEDGWRETCSFSQRRNCRHCCAFFESDVVLVVQVRSSVICKPRNLVLVSVVGQWGVVTRVLLEVYHNLLCLTHIEGQVVCTTPFSRLCHFLSVVHFIVVADETYHWCVIGKLDDVVEAELGSVDMGQQREEQRAEHTALWGPCAQCGSARGVAADTDWLRSSG